MDPEQESQLIADSFDIELELLPFLTELYRDLKTLGGFRHETITVLRESAELPAAARVADLGCGKGDVSIAIARQLGARVHGVDLHQPWIREAVAGAEAAGVAHLCSFERADLRQFVRENTDFDAVIFAAVGASLLGGYAECVAALRQGVRPGGAIVVSDGFLTEKLSPADVFEGYEYYRTHDEAVRQLTSHGDALVRELRVEPGRLAKRNRSETAKVRYNVRRLIERYPQHRQLFADRFARDQAEGDFIERATAEVVWLLRRA